MRTIFQAVKTGVLNGISAAITFAIFWKVTEAFEKRSVPQEFEEAGENTKIFFSNLWDAVNDSLGK